MAGLCLLCAQPVWAGAQKEEPLSYSVRAMMQQSISDLAPSHPALDNEAESRVWMVEMSRRLARRLPDAVFRADFLRTVYYEAARAGLDPQLVLGLIEVESGFRKYAVSTAGARGFMQVMPFWVRSIGEPQHNLFHLRVNLRYGCTILRHYLAMERGDLFRALGRYNGSLGRPEYPALVLGAWRRHWNYSAARHDAAGVAARP